MSVNNNKDYLYLIWESYKSGNQYIVGQLSKNGQYEFKYGIEVQKAIDDGFTPLISFPDISSTYYNNELFPVFSSRLPDKKRKDIDVILKKYKLESYDSYNLLKMCGAKLPIDNIHFIDPILDFKNEFERIFCLKDVMLYLGCNGVNCEKSYNISIGDTVFLEKESKNDLEQKEIKVMNVNKECIGYVPNYYSEAYTRLIDEKRKINCNIVSVEKNNKCNECIYIKAVVN